MRLPTAIPLAASVALALALAAPVSTVVPSVDWKVRAAPVGATSTYYVSPLGSDANPGTLDEPFRTLSFALGRLRPGGTLLVRGGTYSERVKLDAKPGRRDARILVSSYPGEYPLVEGQLWLGYPSYWTISGINVTWAPGNPNEPMVRLFGGTKWILQNAEIWGAHSTSALHVDDGPRDNLGRWTVRNNCIHDTYPSNGINQDHNIYVDDMSESREPQGLINRNILFNATNGRGIKLGPGDGSGGPSRVKVRYNTIYNSSQNIGLSYDAARIRLSRNLLVTARESNIRGYRLEGKGNVASNNFGAGAPRFMQNDPGYTGIQKRGGNVVGPLPTFDSMSCVGFHPTVPLPYGRYA